MKMTSVFERLMLAVSLRSAWRHQARLQAHVRLAHLALDLGLGRQRRHRVDDHDVDRAGAHQHVGDLQRLLAVVGLRDQQLVHVHAELARVVRVERVLGVDEGGGAAQLLHLGDHRQGQRRLAGRFRAVDLDDAAARQPADAERDVEPERAGGNHLDVLRHLGFAEPHDRALAELLLDLREGGLQGLALVVVHDEGGNLFLDQHRILP